MNLAQALRAEADRNAAFMARLRQSLPTFTVPIADSIYTMPGWMFVGEIFYSYDDVAYPIDPAVLRMIREFCPSAVPIYVKSIYRWANYRELGHLGPPVVFVRHAIARVVRDPILPTHNFRCEGPVYEQPWDRTDAHVLVSQAPNWIEHIWHDKQRRPHGYDLPGEYLPFDWEYAYALRAGYRDQESARDQSRRILAPYAARHEKQEWRRSRHYAGCSCDDCYIDRSIRRDQARLDAKLSDVEWKEAALAPYQPPAKPIQVAVPALPGE